MSYKLLPPGRRGKFWTARGTFAGRRREASTGQTVREDAERWAADWAAGIYRHEVPDASDAVTFGRAAQAFIHFKRPTLDDERLILALADWFKDRPVKILTHAHLVDAARALRPHGSNATRNRKIIGPAAAVLHYAADQGWCEYRRFKKFAVSRKSPREPVSDADMGRLMAATDGPHRLLLAILYETGLRISDALSLAWNDVDLTAGRVSVRISKTDDSASLPLSPSLVVLLANMPGRVGRVLPWTSRMSVYKWLRPLCRRLGIAYTPHQSRHALASALLAAGVPDKAAADYGVWRDPRSLQRYQQVRPEHRPERNAGSLLGSPPTVVAKKRG